MQWTESPFIPLVNLVDIFKPFPVLGSLLEKFLSMVNITLEEQMSAFYYSDFLGPQATTGNKKKHIVLDI